MQPLPSYYNDKYFVLIQYESLKWISVLVSLVSLLASSLASRTYTHEDCVENWHLRQTWVNLKQWDVHYFYCRYTIMSAHHLMCSSSSLGRLYSHSCSRESLWHLVFWMSATFFYFINRLYYLEPRLSLFKSSAREEAQFRVCTGGRYDIPFLLW